MKERHSLESRCSLDRWRQRYVVGDKGVGTRTNRSNGLPRTPDQYCSQCFQQYDIGLMVLCFINLFISVSTSLVRDVLIKSV